MYVIINEWWPNGDESYSWEIVHGHEVESGEISFQEALDELHDIAYDMGIDVDEDAVAFSADSRALTYSRYDRYYIAKVEAV